VNLLEDGDEALIVDGPFLGGQRLAIAELLQNVIHAGEGESGVLGLTGLAVGV
jgi:hypothetical protein